MIRSNVSRAVRHLRRRQALRQADLGARAAVSGPTVSRVERGLIRGVPVGTLERIAGALGATVDVTVRWQGEQLDRLLDAAHASIEEQSAAFLTASGWSVRPEVSFNHYGDRGRVDLLAFHPGAGVVLVIEAKGSIGDLQDALGRLDVKLRLGRSLADASGWSGVRAIVPVFVLRIPEPSGAPSRCMRRSLPGSRYAEDRPRRGSVDRPCRPRPGSCGS